MSAQKFYAVRVVVEFADFTRAERIYVRGNTRMGCYRFSMFALGDMMMLTAGHGAIKSWEIENVSHSEWLAHEDNRPW